MHEENTFQQILCGCVEPTNEKDLMWIFIKNYEYIIKSWQTSIDKFNLIIQTKLWRGGPNKWINPDSVFRPPQATLVGLLINASSFFCREAPALPRTDYYCVCSIPYIRHEDFRSFFVMLRGPPLKSETGCTGELWSNRVLLILKN